MSDDLRHDELPWPYNLEWPPGVEPDYESIIAFADAHGINREDLLALSEDRDPFYSARESLRRDGEWFAAQWERYGSRERWERTDEPVHLRSLMYTWTQQTTPPALPRTLAKSQKTLLLDKECWKYLVHASGPARYLGLVPVEAIIDEKNPDAQIRSQTARYTMRIDVESNDWQELELPDFPDPPTLALRFVTEGQTVADHSQRQLYSPGLQRYHQEVWTEKSTQDVALREPCIRHHVTQQSAQGEFSWSKALEFSERVRPVGKPAIGWYISDCDPRGWSMPTAFSRKVEWCTRHIPRYHALDITIIRLLLSPEQVDHYGLPWSEIKESERRGRVFEERQGTDGSCEVDAVEALHPGQVPHLAQQAFRHFFDADLEPRCAEVEERTREDMEEASEEVAEETTSGPSFMQRYAALRERYNAWRQEAAQGLAKINAERAALVEEWADALEEHKPDLDEPEYEVPEPAERDLRVSLSLPATSGNPATELPLPVVLHSPWDYLRQLYAYHRFQRREPQRRAGYDTHARVLALARQYPEWSKNKLAKELGLDPKTVRRHLKDAAEEGAWGGEA